MHPLIIAELSCNHLGSLDTAMRLVEAAAHAGADAVKLQTFMPSHMVGDDRYVVESGPWKGTRLIDLYREAWTPWEWHKDLFDCAKDCGIEAFSSPFSSQAIDFLEILGCPRYKIASFELTDLPLIRAVAHTRKPMILSTGMATVKEIAEAVTTARAHGCRDLTLLKCTSGYPTPASQANLATMRDMRSRWACKVGVSDHSLGIGVAVAAAALGADMIEKHLTLSRADGGPDSEFSMEPQEFAQMTAAARMARDAIGEVQYGPTPAETPQLALRRSLYFARELKLGDKIKLSDVKTARPCLGLAPRELGRVVGKRVRQQVAAGDPVVWEAIG